MLAKLVWKTFHSSMSLTFLSDSFANKQNWLIWVTGNLPVTVPSSLSCPQSHGFNLPTPGTLFLTSTTSTTLFGYNLCGFGALQNALENPARFIHDTARSHRMPEGFHFLRNILMMMSLPYSIAIIREAEYFGFHIHQIWLYVIFSCMCVCWGD